MRNKNIAWKFVVEFVTLAFLVVTIPNAQAHENASSIKCHPNHTLFKNTGLAGQWEMGAFSSPPKGPGAGKLVAWKVGTNQTCTIAFGKPHTLSGNSFYIAYDEATQQLFVPSLAGQIFIFNARTFFKVGRLVSPQGSRVARVSPNDKVLFVLSLTKTAAYALPSHRLLYEREFGGNAIAFDPNGRFAYIGGNMNRSLIEIETENGKVVHVYPISHSGDIAYADGKIFSANMRTGIMSVLYTHSGKIVNIPTPEVDPHFSYRHIPQATAGFMQLAVDPARHRLYAAGFSGHILKFSTSQPAYLGRIKVAATSNGGSNKLSGISVLDGGGEALVTVENIKTAVVVNLSNGHFIRRLPGIASNRWLPIDIPRRKAQPH
ncbi:hypothetical protein BI364_08335 [Acidihalobacter yilgarnensis]|uniref:SMP-30/Gluconolactonase/LRE-like region domain-containing protein n=1 Tax=Acidihalobacter yilgarnensis TaxID=2819280 RepID=A0A1D8INI1_9GAMM|nr:WD40 repeat domain-containing protein [Acidihalobacter yilgarnensis]AOU97971.1 hypothetical protein BI364_08335 [Acidihalobacter yilgarnensis]